MREHWAPPAPPAAISRESRRNATNACAFHFKCLFCGVWSCHCICAAQRWLRFPCLPFQPVLRWPSLPMAAEAGEAALLPLHPTLHRQCHMRRLRCRTWQRRQHRIWQHRIWRRRPLRISPQRRTWPRRISLHLRTAWRCRTADRALPPRMGRLTRLSGAHHLATKLPTSRRAAVSRTAQGARHRPRRAPSSTARPMRRRRP